ncbi:MAG TPA: hypothetical protein ENJ10_09575 [Caldithrix abyssi]|uniref:DUF3307 domain-containing protein n=1 Tax=Caldithrix abyssi TaxID=187145 RepID=A0A7V1LMX8_CALAY|nr:hypothetical protein [Caldithrix abyssi]
MEGGILMTTDAILFFLLLYWSGRLLFYDIRALTEERKPGGRDVLYRGLWSLCSLLFWENMVVAGLLTGVHLLMVMADSFTHIRGKSLTTFILHNLALGLALMLLRMFPVDMSAWFAANPLAAVWDFLRERIWRGTPPVQKASLWLAALTAMLYTVKEATILIRLVLNTVRATPVHKDHPEKQDTAEYERGRLIGILERLLFYVMVLFNQPGAIAIVVAIKSLARFKDLDNRPFAEYFLIGSLLSLATAAAPALIVRLLFF